MAAISSGSSFNGGSPVTSFFANSSGMLLGGGTQPVTSASGSGGGNATNAGFIFAPGPLYFGGQTISPNFVFSEPQVVDQVDQASQAYAFTTGLLSNTESFVNTAAQQAYASATPIFGTITNALQQIGTTEAQALNTAASKLSSGCSGFLSCLL